MSDGTEDETPLDRAVRLVGEDASDAGSVFDALFNAELALLLEEEPRDDRFRPALLELESGPTALAFDTVDRLAAFTDRPAPYAAMPGRALVSLLAEGESNGRKLSLAVNPGVAPSELFYGPEALAWAVEFLADRPAEEDARILAFGPPHQASETLLAALDAKLAALSMALAEAWLVGAEFDGKAPGLLLVLRMRAPGGEAGVAQAAVETARLADPDGVGLDVAFAAEGEPLLDNARRAGLGFDMPEPKPVRPAPAAPGSDPARPPKLR